jgi:hypothetical protein
LRGKTDLFFKQYAERADAFEAYIITDLGNREVLARQPLTGLLDSFTGEILMRGASVDTGKEPVEMKTREACLPGKTVKVNGFMKVFVHVYLGHNDLSIYVRCDRHPAEFALIQI